ncbi:MAG TPA: PAS domain S-box protein [Cellvibrionaceae bacterium]
MQSPPDGDKAPDDDTLELLRAHGIILLNAVPSGIVLLNDAGVIVYCNSEAARLFAYEIDELQGKLVECLIPQEYRHSHVGVRQEYFTQSTPRFMGAGRDLYGQRKDGSYFPVEIGLRPLKFAQKQFVLASVMDITERKKAHAQLSTVIDSSPYGKIIVDKTGAIRLVNHRCVSLFGYSREELLGQPIEMLLPERYRQIHQVHLRNFFAQPSLRAMGEGRDLTGRHTSGREIPIEIGLAPLDFAGELHVLVCITDITHRKRLESDLREANAQLEEFTYVVSHDLKSPMRGISDLTEWIIEDLGETVAPEVTNNLQRIQTRIQRMENLTEDLLMYARAAKRTKEIGQINLPELVAGILELVTLPEQAKVTVQLDVEEIVTTKAPLETVLRNLISNAIKHHDAPERFQLTISSEASGSYLRMRVCDNGPGIPIAAQERVFRLFQTLSGSGTALGGVGLAVAKRLSEAHGGRLEIDNEEGARGCCFVLWWPRFLRSDFDE